ncbi:MAG: hypothetical protein CMM01_03085 [Rhodopirellula sp.]|nr:hypothetical protein [Rhodopirellula sp.]OUX52255.1 MAG: hypothetical protein CBE43_01040 [Rhodopirellula sp. TMED283]
MQIFKKFPLFCRRTSKQLLFISAVIPCTASSQVAAQGHTQRGATVGGIAGAVAGAAIGDHNGETGAGAAIGGIIGAFAGGLLGNAEDKQQAYQRQRQYQTSQKQLHEHQRTAVSAQDVVAMTRNGLSEQVIINQIQQRGVQKQPQVADIIALHQQGVSESIITAMQQAQHRPTSHNRVTIPVTRKSSPQSWYGPVIPPTHSYHVVPSYPPPRCYYYPEPIYHYHHGYSSRIQIRF